MRPNGTVLVWLLLFQSTHAHTIGIAVAAAAGPVAELSRAAGFTALPQIGAVGRASVRLLLGTRVAAGAALGVRLVAPSPTREYYGYRGYQASTASLFADIMLPDGFPAGLGLRTGLTAGLDFGFARYSHTLLYFFYPGITVAPFAMLPLDRARRLWLRLAVPASVAFRRDLLFSAGLGLSVGLMFRKTALPSGNTS